MPIGKLLFGNGGLIAMAQAGKAAERIADYLEDEGYETHQIDRHGLERSNSSEEDYREPGIVPTETYENIFVPEEQEPGLVPVENYIIFSQNPEENNNGGDNIMTELESDYFQERGETAVELVGESDEDYSDDELEAYGVALDLWLAENDQIDVEDSDIAAYAQEQGLLTDVMDAKEAYQEELDIEGTYDEIVAQEKERAGDAGYAAMQISQLEFFVDRMSEGTERVAQSHEDTEPTYEELRGALSSGAETMDTAVDRLMSARESKGLDPEGPEDLQEDIEYLQILDQSIEDATEDLEELQQEGEEIDVERLKELEEQTEDRTGMKRTLDRLEE